MSKWYRAISSAKDFYVPLGDAIVYFQDEYLKAKAELKPKRGILMTELSLNIPGMVEYRYGQLQELEAILLFLNIQYDIKKGNAKRNFLENYNRTLTDRQVDTMANIDPDVIIIREFINETALVRNQFLGVSKGLEYLHFQMGNLTKLKIAGFDDATL
jgi:hypothetical protein